MLSMLLLDSSISTGIVTDSPICFSHRDGVTGTLSTPEGFVDLRRLQEHIFQLAHVTCEGKVASWWLHQWMRYLLRKDMAGNI